MPLYTYRCKGQNCDYIYEEFYFTIELAEKEEPLFLEMAVCPKCNSRLKERYLQSGPGLNFKGPGWTPSSNSTSNPKDDSTSRLKERAKEIKENLKNLKSDDLYNVPKTKDLGEK